MKRGFVILVVMLVASGCAFKSATTVRQEVGGFSLEPLPADAKYEITGDTEGSVSGGVCLGCIPVGLPNNMGTFYSATPTNRGCMDVIGGLATAVDFRADSAAVYNAIENSGGADFLVAPRFKRDGTNYMIYRSINVTVTGKAARIVPN